jgi:hypothetical protein
VSLGRAALIAASLTAACSTGPPPARPAPQPPPVALQWDSTRAAAARFIASGRDSSADSALREFADRHAGTPQAQESIFWSALYRLNPDNHGFTPRDALAALDEYLAGGDAQPRYDEALVLRNAALALDVQRTPPAPAPEPPAPVDSSSAVEHQHEEEIKRLNAELQRTQAELDRIRKRLGTPRPGT